HRVAEPVHDEARYDRAVAVPFVEPPHEPGCSEREENEERDDDGEREVDAREQRKDAVHGGEERCLEQVRGVEGKELREPPSEETSKEDFLRHARLDYAVDACHHERRGERKGRV